MNILNIFCNNAEKELLEADHVFCSNFIQVMRKYTHYFCKRIEMIVDNISAWGNGKLKSYRPMTKNIYFYKR